MTTNERRPDLARIGAAGNASLGANSLDAAHAHTYGVGGVSQTEARMQVRRGLQSLSDAWPDVLVQIIRREIQQAFLEALPAYWCRRAETFEAVGTATADASARACRRHAWLLAEGLPHDVAAELDEWLASEVV